MKRRLAGLLAAVVGLPLAWWSTLIGAEIIRSVFGGYFRDVQWPVWFPTTPIVIVTLILWVLFARGLSRAIRRTFQSAAAPRTS